RLNGRSKGNISQSRGYINLDSLTLYGVQITNIQGPIWIDNNQTLVGSYAKANGGEPSLVGEVFSGKITFDGWVAHNDKYPFLFTTELEKSQLADLATELAPQWKGLSGDGYGYLQMKGEANDLYSYTGNGSFHLQNAKIHQLPIVLSLLKILSIKEVTRNAFDSSNLDFVVSGNRLKFERIELIGDAISLIGNGYMELMRHADINFYSVVGRNRLYIPLVSELYRAGSQRIMWINIGGPWSNLKTTRKVLPGLDDSLRALIRTTEDPNSRKLQR
ncbi:MAG: hypothetical protein AAGA30_17770, partial [Planctomycetota bacterium]